DGDGDPTTGDGDGDGDGDPTTGDGDGDDDCEPADHEVYFSYEPFDFGLIDRWNVDLDWTCTVISANNDDGLQVELDCPDADDPVVIDIDASPSFSAPVLVGDTMQVRYIYEGPWWFNIYLRLDIESYGHVLTLIDGDSLLPPDNHPFEPPFDMTAVSGLCTPASDGCGDLERLALDFEINGEAAHMFDGSHAIVGGDPGTDVWVATAEHLHDIQCTDTPTEWFRVLIANTGWE
ncbi:MAG TPA: hypothetical protein VK034_03490, partial [Enhygromyxa sp.]|nr:hypothetical protein [Enhygromyxa sp.]